jgi:signal transduction histidine kinase
MSLSTSFQNLNKKLFDDTEQQLALIQFGQLALSTTLPEVMKQTVAVISQTMVADIIWVCELAADGNSIIQQAGISTIHESTDQNMKFIEVDSLESLTVSTSDPILVENLAGETRFNTSKLLKQSITSGISLPIGTPEKTLGLIQVFARQPQSFSREDISFLQTLANLLGLAIQRARLEEEMRELKKQLAKAQSVIQSGQSEWDSYEIKNRLRDSRENERLRLAQELHDVPIQDLYGLIYQVDDLRDYLKDSDGERILDEHTQMLQRIVNNLRTICRELRPPSLSPFGLEVAIRDHVEKLRDQNPQLNIQLLLMRDQQVLSDSLRLNLFRIYQQAISNVVRHSEATEAYIRFRWDDNMILLEVEDNGQGFEVPNSWVELVRREHFGLVGLAERLESIRGKLEVRSSLGHGTLVRAIVPRH